MSSTDWKRVPRSGNLSLGKRKKSAGAISGKYGGCSMVFVECLVKNSFKWWPCAKAHYRGAKSKNFLFCSSFLFFSFSFSGLFEGVRYRKFGGYLSQSWMRTFSHYFLHFCNVNFSCRRWWPTRARQILPSHLDRFWTLCATHKHVFLIKSIHRKSSVTFEVTPNTKFHWRCKI